VADGAFMKRFAVAIVLGLGFATSTQADLPLPPARTDLVDVAVDREFRGLWVASVSNLDFPTTDGEQAQKAELLDLVESASTLGFNALVFQVRPEGDALYASELEPWSRFLTGTQGVDPGYDPLEFLTTAAHARGLEVHAWFNPYRAASSRRARTDSRHVSHWAAGSSMAWGGQLWLDPGATDVQDHAVSVVSDVLERYDIDGVHMDDYFYPYPQGTRDFPDQASYDLYTDSGGTLERSAWRRSNVDGLVEQIAGIVQSDYPEVRFGISPFGIYRNGVPEGTRGLDQVETLNADPLKWYREGWVDYLAPQLYWSTQREAQRFDRLLQWWDNQMTDDRPLWVGLDCTKVGNHPEWTLDEMRPQVALSRAAPKTGGQIWFRSTPVLNNQAGLRDLARELYSTPAVPAVLARHADTVVNPPSVRVLEGKISVEHTRRSDLRGFVLYEGTEEGWVARDIVGSHVRALPIREGEWAISAVHRTGVETQGVLVAAPPEAI
jgi:uncharacterized lipoprotein YddW (UPF0748 family)